MPLSDTDIATIKATIPVLQAAGEALTRHFYARMMREKPETRKYFNQTHQKDGSQARALALSLLAYAHNIDNLSALGAVAPQIVQKHVALEVKPEHYPIVGTNLIASMGEVLGPDVATPQVIDAWTEAYFQLADILIGAEKSEYERIESATGGWADWRNFFVAKITIESPDIVSLTLAPQDNKPILVHKAGQYLTLRTAAPDAIPQGQTETRRNYSISSAPSNSHYRITVKKIGAVSAWLHSLKEGDAIELRPPAGEFGLVSPPPTKSPAPVVLIAGGIGVTPLASMAHSLAATSPCTPITLLYYASSLGERALLPELSQLKQLTVPQVGGRRPTLEEIKKHVTPTSTDAAAVPDVYFVGPIGFMRSIKALLSDATIKHPAEKAHFEFFHSNDTL